MVHAGHMGRVRHTGVEVPEVAEKRYADLIVLGTHDASFGPAEAHENTVHRVIAAARCPVVTVRGSTNEGVNHPR